MMRVPQRTGGGTIQLQLTPMIDVVFLLLVFFLWTSSFEQPEYDLPSALALPPLGISDRMAEPPPPEAFDELVITVGGTPDALQLTLNGTPVGTAGELLASLRSVVDLGAQPPVVVDPDPQTQVGLAVDVYDIARRAGLERVLFAAEE